MKPDDKTRRINVLLSKLQEQLWHKGFASHEVKGKDLKWLIVYPQKDYFINDVVLSKVAQIVIDNDGNFKFQLFSVTLGSETVNETLFWDYILQMIIGSNYTICPGILKRY